MSRFYQRYIQGIKKDKDSTVKSRPIDPTAMTSSQISKPLTSKPVTTSENEVSNPVLASNSNAPARRVQIFNASESYSPDQLNQPTVFAKPDSSKNFLFEAIKKNYLFESLNSEDLYRIIDCMKPSFASKDEVIIKQGELGDLFYCLESGTAIATVNNEVVYKYEVAGECFGELALIYNSPRAASIIATSSIKLWTLDLRTFRYILATTSSSLILKRCEFLKKCSFLEILNNDQISKLAGALEVITYKKNDYIVKQGDIADSFFIIEEGEVKCTQIKSNGHEVNLITLKKGDYFGEMALMLNDKRHANCIAVNEVKCLTLNREKFILLLGNIQDVLAKRMRIRILQSVPLLSKLSEKKLLKLSSVMKVQSFNDGSYIIKQGEEGSRFYIINEGEVKCTRNLVKKNFNKLTNEYEEVVEEEELIRLTSQEFFGERALITNELRKANVISVGYTECLVLERNNFQSLLNEVQDDIVEIINEREKNSTSNANDGSNSEEKDEVDDVNDELLIKLKIEENENFSIKYEDLLIKRTIGTGTFGRVKLVQNKKNNKYFALKCMNKIEIIKSHQQNNIKNEKNLLFECSYSSNKFLSNFILKLFKTYNFDNQIMLLMEFINGGELWSLIYEDKKKDYLVRSNYGGFTLEDSIFYISNIILSFELLNKHSIVYRDLKPENLLINSNGYLKIIDFGFSKKIPYVKNNVKYTKTFTLCGTPEYLAPEIIMSKGYDKSVDYWALGCLFYELLLGKTPFQADFTTKIFQNIINSEKNLVFPKNYNVKVVTIIKKLLTFNSSLRLGNLNGGINDIKKDEIFNDLNWDKIERQEVKAPYIPQVGEDLTCNYDEYDEDDYIPEYHDSQEYFEGF